LLALHLLQEPLHGLALVAAIGGGDGRTQRAGGRQQLAWKVPKGRLEAEAAGAAEATVVMVWSRNGMEMGYRILCA
jgi:hypothetical protein